MRTNKSITLYHYDGESERFSRVYFPRASVPFKTGALMQSAASSVIGSGEVCYGVPYARKQYYEGKDSGIRGRMWFERMKADRLGDLLSITAAACGGEVTKT